MRNESRETEEDKKETVKNKKSDGKNKVYRRRIQRGAQLVGELYRRQWCNMCTISHVTVTWDEHVGRMARDGKRNACGYHPAAL